MEKHWRHSQYGQETDKNAHYYLDNYYIVLEVSASTIAQQKTHIRIVKVRRSFPIFRWSDRIPGKSQIINDKANSIELLIKLEGYNINIQQHLYTKITN